MRPGKKIDDIRLVKYEILIEDINSKLEEKPYNFTKAIHTTFFDALKTDRDVMASEETENTGNTALALIFDYEKCNEYAKVIMDKSVLNLSSSKSALKDWWKDNYSTYSSLADIKNRINASKEFVRLCQDLGNKKEGYKFIFWALLILTVDKSDADEHLSLICDFASMLRITDDEFEDIIQVVKFICNEESSDYVFKSEEVPLIFNSLYDMGDASDEED